MDNIKTIDKLNRIKGKIAETLAAVHTHTHTRCIVF